MIYFSENDRKKLVVLDELFSRLDETQLKELLDSEVVVSKLKGTEPGTHILSGMVDNINALQIEISSIRSQMYQLQTDISTILQWLCKPTDYSQVSAMQTVKSRHGIY